MTGNYAPIVCTSSVDEPCHSPAAASARHARVPDCRVRIRSSARAHGPERTDLDRRAAFCGFFRTPALRNVALKQSFFHNGIYHSLADVLRFYARRDTNPELFYPVVKGKVRKFDDLPRRYWANLNTVPPFDRKPGDAPVITDTEIKGVLAFLDTLTDGWQSQAR